MNSPVHRAFAFDPRPIFALYLAACLVYYLATWWGYGGFSGGHPPIWSLEEFFASSGLKFSVYFVVSVGLLRGSVWLEKVNPWLKTALAGVVFLVMAGLLQELLLGWFGWVQFFGGKLAVFNHLFTAGFFSLQCLLFLWLRERHPAVVPDGRGRGMRGEAEEQGPVAPVPEILFGSRGKARFPLSVPAVSHIIACRNYATVTTGEGTYLLDCGIGEAEQRLAGAGFLRVHRSYLVNLAHLTCIERAGRGHRLVMTDGERIPVGAKYLEGLRNLGY